MKFIPPFIRKKYWNFFKQIKAQGASEVNGYSAFLRLHFISCPNKFMSSKNGNGIQIKLCSVFFNNGDIFF